MHKAVIIGAGVVGLGVGAWWLYARSQASNGSGDAASASSLDPSAYAGTPGSAWGPAGLDPYGGAFAPASGGGDGSGGGTAPAPMPLPPGPGGDSPAVIHLSPDTETALLAQNQALNDQVAQATRTGQAIQAAAATVATVPVALYYGAKVARPLASAFQGAGRAASGAFENVAARLAAPGATIADLGAVTWTGAAVGVGAGVALGVGAVKVLQDTGALDKVDAAGKALDRATNAGEQRILKTAALPLSIPGAFVSALVGHGSAINDVRGALRGTFLGDWLHA
jgi:hypothetical protein